MTNRAMRQAFHQRQRAAYVQALSNPTGAEMRQRIGELADAGRSDEEVAATVGLSVTDVRRVLGERRPVA